MSESGPACHGTWPSLALGDLTCWRRWYLTLWVGWRPPETVHEPFLAKFCLAWGWSSKVVVAMMSPSNRLSFWSSFGVFSGRGPCILVTNTCILILRCVVSISSDSSGHFLPASVPLRSWILSLVSFRMVTFSLLIRCKSVASTFYVRHCVMQRKEKMVPRGPGLQVQICRGLCDCGLALETLFLSERGKVARFSK